MCQGLTPGPRHCEQGHNGVCPSRYFSGLPAGPGVPWPLQDIRLLRGCCARINHPCIPPPICIAHPGAILLHDYWTVLDSPPDLPLVCNTLYNIDKNNIV